MFAQGHINRELGKEGVLPWSKVWASNWPFDAPLAGHGLRSSFENIGLLILTNVKLDWFICVLIIFFAPAGDTYNLVINLVRT